MIFDVNIFYYIISMKPQQCPQNFNTECILMYQEGLGNYNPIKFKIG
jgi:hypothetical protein